MRALCAMLLLLLLTVAAGAHAEPPPLRHGINVTGWFRFPASLDPGALRRWIGDDALTALHRAGFDFVRLAVDPAMLQAPAGPESLTEALGRLRKAGLVTLVSLHPSGWHLESDAGDRERLAAAWRTLADLLGPTDPRWAVAELLNEPVFPGQPGEWQALQHRLLTDLRRKLPNHTVVLTGNDWGSVGGLLAMTPEADGNVIYSVHLYDPAELTSLAAWRFGLDRTALARLPFPVSDEAACQSAAEHTDAETAGVIRYYCALRWNADRITTRLDLAARWGRDHKMPILLGEFGATAALNASARGAWITTVRSAAERAGMAWALWGYDDVMGLNVPRPPGAHPALDTTVLEALGLGRQVIAQERR